MPKRVTSLFVEAVDQFAKDRAPRLSAALAFYTVISLAPLLLVIIGIAGHFYGEDAVRGELVAQIQGAVGLEVATLVENALSRAAVEAEGWRMALIGVGGLLIGASTLFVHLKVALNDIWGIEPKQAGGGVLRAVKDFLIVRVLAVAAIIGIGVVLLTMLITSAAIEAMAVWFDDLLPLPAIIIRAGTVTISLGVVTVLFAYIYRTLPDVRIQWAEVWLGALVTAILFSIGKELIAVYLGRSAIGSAYGAAGSLVILLVWVYYSALIFFFGAELTQVYSARYGSVWKGRRGFHVTSEALAAPAEEATETIDTGPDRPAADEPRPS